MTCEGLLTQHANSGLRGHLEVSRHHVLDVEASALLLRWDKERKTYLTNFQLVLNFGQHEE